MARNLNKTYGLFNPDTNEFIMVPTEKEFKTIVQWLSKGQEKHPQKEEKFDDFDQVIE